MMALERGRLGAYGIYILFAALRSTSAEPVTLWDAISTNGSFSVLLDCIQKADASITDLLKDASTPHTLFAPINDAFSSSSGDPCGNDPSRTVKYLISKTVSTSAYIGEAFPTLLENGSSVYAFAISKDTKTAKEFPPILYINNGQGLSWTPVGKNVLVPLGSLIAPPPPGVNGSIWDVLTSRPELSKTVELLSKLPDLQAALSSLPDMKKRTGYYTLLAPDNDAWAKVPSDKMQRLETSEESLSMLFNFHLLNKGSYPRSTTGMFYSPQFFPTTSAEPSVIYAQFYRAQSSFSGLRLSNGANILLDLSRPLNGSLTVSGVPITTPDLSAYNGVIHVMAGVLPLPDSVAATVAAPPFPLSVAGNFTVLSQLVQAAPASVKDTLQTGGPLTLLAPTDAAFDAAFSSGRLPALSTLLEDADAIGSLLSYHILTPAPSVLLFNPTDDNPFADDFKDGAQILDASQRVVTLHRRDLGTVVSPKVNDTSVFATQARLYQCTQGQGWGHDCSTARPPTPSNTYAINDDHLVCMVHAIDEVMLPPSSTLLELLYADPSLSSFLSLLHATNLTSLLTEPADPMLTLFVPTNDHLEALNASRPWLFTDTTAIAEVVRYHLVPSLWYSRWLSDAQRLPTLALGSSAPVLITTSASSFLVNGQAAVSVDVTGTNGVLHKLGGVLVPDVLQIAYAAAGLSDAVTRIAKDPIAQAAALSLGPVTFFGPTNAALASPPPFCSASYHQGAEPAPINLAYHLARDIVDYGNLHPTIPVSSAYQGLHLHPSLAPETAANLCLSTDSPLSGAFINQAAVDLPGFQALNGMVYRTHAVLQAPVDDLWGAMLADEDMVPFAELIRRLDLQDQVAGTGPYTAFVPTASVLNSIYKADKIFGDTRQARQLVSYHLMLGRLFTAQLAAVVNATKLNDDYCPGVTLPTRLDGKRLSVQVVSSTQTFVSSADQAFNAEVIRPNYNAANGVIHLIDGFLTFPGYMRPQ